MEYRQNRTDKQYLTVSGLNQYVKLLMDGDDVLQEVALRGEISNFKRHAPTGHLYFSLKDASSSVRCVMFAGNASRLRFPPKDGDDVLAFGNVTVFPRDGSYQLYVSVMQPSGAGAQAAALEALKRKLAAEGLFDEARKKPLPRYPRTVGLVTSDTGAAVRDLLDILGRRFRAANVILYPALVQGPGAPASVIEGIRYFNLTKCVDVIIIGRGGGSGEDLAAFNDEALARTVAASEIPLISAVGHETDFTIADFVADMRAPTPSAAAELAVPDSLELYRRLADWRTRASRTLENRIGFLEGRLDFCANSSVLRKPDRFIDLRENELCRLSEKMHSLSGLRLSAAEKKLENLNGRLDSRATGAISGAEMRLSSLSGRMETGINACLNSAERGLTGAAASLDAMSPLRVLARGYGAISSENGYVSGAAGLSAGERVRIRMHDGTVSADVTGIEIKTEGEQSDDNR